MIFQKQRTIRKEKICMKPHDHHHHHYQYHYHPKRLMSAFCQGSWGCQVLFNSCWRSPPTPLYKSWCSFCLVIFLGLVHSYVSWRFVFCLSKYFFLSLCFSLCVSLSLLLSLSLSLLLFFRWQTFFFSFIFVCLNSSCWGARRWWQVVCAACCHMALIFAIMHLYNVDFKTIMSMFYL